MTASVFSISPKELTPVSPSFKCILFTNIFASLQNGFHTFGNLCSQERSTTKSLWWWKKKDHDVHIHSTKSEHFCALTLSFFFVWFSDPLDQ